MCGRFTLYLAELRELRKLLGVQRNLIADWRPRYNIAPSQAAPVALVRDERVLENLQWGLVPHWSKTGRAVPHTINARAESIARKPIFREAFQQRRCIVPTTGYYEWGQLADRPGKRPVWVHAREGDLVLLAGLWESWLAPSGEQLASFTIVTTEAQGELRSVHSRMPLELRSAQIERWLEPGPMTERELDTFVEAAQEVAHLELREVDPQVNSPSFDAPACIEPVSDAGSIEERLGQLKLFG